MNKLLAIFFNVFCCIFFVQSQNSNIQNPMVLWYRQPALQRDTVPYDYKRTIGMWEGGSNGWNEALPIGNGKMGAMVFGGVFRERIQLNEESLWDGFASDSDNPLSLIYLKEIQKAMFEGRNIDAENMAQKYMLGKPVNIKSFQSLADFYININPINKHKSYTNYQRSLSLDSAVTRVSYSNGGVQIKREIFASHADNVIVLKITADKQGTLNGNIQLMREKDAVSYVLPNDNNCLVQTGQISCLDKSTGENKGMRFETMIKVMTEAGEVKPVKNRLIFQNCTELVFIIAAATNYAEVSPRISCEKTIKNALKYSYNELLERHLTDYQPLYSKSTIKLESESVNAYKYSTDELLKLSRNGKHQTYLSELLFQYGRYLLIASSRKGDLPANLQGIWCQHLNAPWNSDYHTNINLQMNYWPTQVSGLEECELPLFDLIDSLRLRGTKTAKEMYGARGWVVHHLTDVFFRTSPADGYHGVWPMGAAWLSRHLWEHYAYSQDIDFLRDRAYPVMKDAALFLLDFLVEIPKGLPYAGCLITNPSHSPENAFEKKDGVQSQFTYGATMDIEIANDLFKNCIAAIQALSVDNHEFDADFRNALETSIKRLPPIQISKRTGKIQEWIEDYKETELGHRHFSHLYALYPGCDINPYQTPDLCVAASKTIEARLWGNPNAKKEEAHNRFGSYDGYLKGKGGTNWQRAWIACLWARLLEPEKAYEQHIYQMNHILKYNLMGDGQQQLDGNYGLTAAMAEMLIQSYNNIISLLPALPKAWNTGSVTGFRARGGYVIDFTWENGKIKQVKLKSSTKNTCNIRLNRNETIPQVVKVENQEIVPFVSANRLMFEILPEKIYTINF